VVIWEFPERYLPMVTDLSGFDPQWIAQLKNSTSGTEQLVSAADKGSASIGTHQ
jgi:alginate O-acetyltransferase complex protein AlgJ